MALLADVALRAWAVGPLLDCTRQSEARRDCTGLGLSRGLSESVLNHREFRSRPHCGSRGGGVRNGRHRSPSGTHPSATNERDHGLRSRTDLGPA